MKNNDLYKKTRRWGCVFLLLITTLLSNVEVIAQTVSVPPANDPHTQVKPPQIIEPDTSGIGFTKYGNVPVTHTSGANSFSIPLYTYKDEDLELPILLRYASTGYKPNAQTGIVGLGWVLDTGGYVMREIKGEPDEIIGSEMPDAGDNPQFFGATSDIYYFRYPGNSGSFMYKDTKSQNGKLKSHELLIKESQKPFGEISIKDLGFFSVENAESTYRWMDNYFITDENSNLYIFGGSTDDFSRPIRPYMFDRRSKWMNDYGYQWGTKTVWPLNRISTPNGERIDFIYGTSVNDYALGIRRECSAVGGTAIESEIDGSVEYWKYSQFEIGAEIRKTKLLQEIKITRNGRLSVLIEFNYTEKEKERLYNWFPTDMNDGSVLGGLSGKEGGLSRGKDVRIPNNGKLSSITITDLTKSPAKVIKKIEFYYTYAKSAYPLNSYNDNPLMFLDSVAITGEGTYTFGYNNTHGFPRHGTTDIDRWGYYNGKNEVEKRERINGKEVVFNSYNHFSRNPTQNPDFEHTMIGMLTSVKYPTGGTSIFEYEQNDYSAVLMRGPVNGGGVETKLVRCADNLSGGVRLKSITEVSTPDRGSISYDTLSHRRFEYRNNGRSSGVSHCYARSVINPSQNQAEYFDYGNYYSYDAAYAPDNISAMNQTMEYSHVTEIRVDGAYTEYQYTSYFDTPDVNCRSYQYRDSFDVGTWYATPMPHSRSEHRGKLLSVKQFDSAGRLITSTVNAYPAISEYSYLDGTYIDRHYGYLHRQYYGPTHLKKSVYTEYFNNARDSLVSTTLYTYNQHGQHTRKETSNSNDPRTQITQVKFLHEETKDYYRLKYPRYITKIVKEDNQEKIVDETRLSYGLFLRNIDYNYISYYLPQLTKIEKLLLPIGTDSKTYVNDAVFDLYDTNGRLLQTTDKNNIKTAYIWGYNGLYPVAIIENAPDYSVIENLMGVHLRAVPMSGGLSASINSALRSMIGSLVTTCEYSPYVGMTEITDPQGRKTKYTYYETMDDKHGRLKDVVDNENNPVQKYEYNNKR